MSAIALSGGVDSFIVARRLLDEGEPLELAVFVDFKDCAGEREREACMISAEALGLPVHIVEVAGIFPARRDDGNIGLLYKYPINVFLAASVARSKGIMRLHTGDPVLTGSELPYVKNISGALMTSALIQPGVELVCHRQLTAEEKAEFLLAHGIDEHNYWFATCNYHTECGRCFGCRNKQDLFNALRSLRSSEHSTTS